MKTPGRSLVAAQLLGWTGFAVLFALLSIPALPHPSLGAAFEHFVTSKLVYAGIGCALSFVLWAFYERLLPRTSSIAVLGAAGFACRWPWAPSGSPPTAPPPA